MEAKIEKENLEKILLVGVDDGTDSENFEYSMEELASLAKACFMEPVGVITQKMESINKGLYIGTGKVLEVREAAENLEAEVIVFDNSLSPSQLRNLQKETKKPVLDRTSLILDIFERRAKTREAKLQVETAKLKYLLPRLVGMHEALTRQGGTSGSMSSRGGPERKSWSLTEEGLNTGLPSSPESWRSLPEKDRYRVKGEGKTGFRWWL